MSTGNEQVQRVRSMYGEEWGRFAERWVGCALRTAPIEPSAIVPAIEDLYGLAGLGKPRVVIVSSPGVLAFAGAFAAEIWGRRVTHPTFDPVGGLSGVVTIPAGCKAIVEATMSALKASTALPRRHQPAREAESDLLNAVRKAAYDPADLATVNSLGNDVWMDTRGAVEEMEALSYWNECMRDAMRDEFGNPRPTEMMAAAAQDWAQPLAIALFGDTGAQHVVREAANWWMRSQAGNMWLHDTACIAAARELRNVSVPEQRSFSVWERCQLNGGYRFLHPEFCLVSDFPEMLDETGMDHPTQVRSRSLQERQAAPAMRWLDGWLV